MIENSLPQSRGERELVKVQSASRPGTVNFVDPDNERCSCRGFTTNGHCWHLESVKCIWCSGYGTQDPLKTYPRLVECPACSGTGRAA